MLLAPAGAKHPPPLAAMALLITSLPLSSLLTLPPSSYPSRSDHARRYTRPEPDAASWPRIMSCRLPLRPPQRVCIQIPDHLHAHILSLPARRPCLCNVPGRPADHLPACPADHWCVCLSLSVCVCLCARVRVSPRIEDAACGGLCTAPPAPPALQLHHGGVTQREGLLPGSFA